ncbi:MAG: hypothetical protein Q9195_005328 [Heterodermia aff. obscurata]
MITHVCQSGQIPSAPSSSVLACTQDLVNALEAIKQVSDRRAQGQQETKILIIENLGTGAMLSIGAHFDIDPNIFGYYFNRKTSVQTFHPESALLVYPETILFGDEYQTATEDDLFFPQNMTPEGVLTKMWTNLYTYSRRILLAKSRHRASQTPLTLILVDGLPRLKEGALNLPDIPSELWNIVNRAPHLLAQLDIYRSLVGALESPFTGIEASEVADIPVLEFVCQKWRTLTYYTHSKIFESRVPLSGNLSLVAEIIQRKNDFEKWNRAMLANVETAELLAEPLKKADQSQSPAESINKKKKIVAAFQASEVKIARWATQLEKVSDSLQGLLAIQQAQKVNAQVTRTQNLTILAFIFLPISTVSSIYGMNTLEIQSNFPPTWSFAVTAAGVSAISIAFAWLYTVRANTGIVADAKFLAQARSSTRPLLPPSPTGKDSELNRPYWRSPLHPWLVPRLDTRTSTDRPSAAATTAIPAISTTTGTTLPGVSGLDVNVLPPAPSAPPRLSWPETKATSAWANLEDVRDPKLGMTEPRHGKQMCNIL